MNWIDVKDYEGLYQLTRCGQVRSLDRLKCGGGDRWYIFKGRVLKHKLDQNGYPYITAYKNGCQKNFRIHQLIAKHFIPNPHNKKEVNHINAIKGDYRIENLEWVTHKENYEHASRMGIMKQTPEHSRKIGDALRGKPKTKEHIEKMKETKRMKFLQKG